MWADTYFGYRKQDFRHPLQRPDYLYYPALPPQAWYQAGAVPQWQGMVGRVAAVAQELRGFLHDSAAFRPYVGTEARNDALWKDLSGRTAWSSMHLLKRGERSPCLDLLPQTRALIDAAPLAQCLPHAPECFVSRLEPQAVLPAHYGLSNIKLTVHLPVELPPAACSITVAGQTRTWQEGQLLIFDDSFLHSAENRSDRNRTVLIFDIWNPLLGTEEQVGIAHAIAVLHLVNKVTAP